MSQLAANLTNRFADFELKRLQKIHEKGYWRVRIWPTEFHKNLISSLEQCRKTLRSSVVSLRGWDYPSFFDEEVAKGLDWVQGGADFAPYVEFWRFYQSGQFVHHFAMREDYEDPPQRVGSEQKFLDVSLALFRATEIFEFATRLASHIPVPRVDISIELVGTYGRVLKHRSNPFRPASHECRIPLIQFEAAYETIELLGNSGGLALGAAKSIFERFNWNSIPEKILAEDQRKFLERRL